MEFAPRELCEKLAAMGCKSDAPWHYHRWVNLGDWQLLAGKPLENDIQAFVQNDFTGATEQADKNLKIIFGDRLVAFLEAWIYHKGQIIFCHTAYEIWWQYLERTMRK